MEEPEALVVGNTYVADDGTTDLSSQLNGLRWRLARGRLERSAVWRAVCLLSTRFGQARSPREGEWSPGGGAECAPKRPSDARAVWSVLSLLCFLSERLRR